MTLALAALLPARSPLPARPQAGLLSEHERTVLLAVAEAAMPASGGLEGGSPATIARFEHWLGQLSPNARRGLGAGFLALEASPLPTRGRPFSRLPLEARMEVLAAWEQSRLHPVRALLRALLTPLKHAH